MDVHLSAAETAKWNTSPDWKAGFLAAAVEVIANDIMVVRIFDDSSTLLATYKRVWQPV